MALIVCPECGKNVSSMAEKCPDCGYPVNLMPKESVKNTIVSDGDKNQKEVLVEKIAKALKSNEQDPLEKIKKDIESNNTKLSQYENEKKELGLLLETLPEKLSQITVLNNDISEAKAKIEELQNERGRLGIFSGKRKKAIDSELFELSLKIDNIEKELTKNKEMTKGYSVDSLCEKISDVDKEISQTNTKIDQLDAKYQKILNSSEKVMGRQEALDLINGDKELAILLAYKHFDIVKKQGISIQLGNYNNCKDWLVLAKDEDKEEILVISKYVVCDKCFGGEYDEDDEIDGDELDYMTWETSYMREWLNTTYIDDAFNSDERELIAESDINSYDNNGGNNTTDRVFLLSADDARKYFKTDVERQTTFADGSISDWGLRDTTSRKDWPNYFSGITGASLEYGGEISDFYCGYTDEVGVRPAMWLDVSKLI